MNTKDLIQIDVENDENCNENTENGFSGNEPAPIKTPLLSTSDAAFRFFGWFLINVPSTRKYALQ